MDWALLAKNNVSFLKVYVRRHEFGDEDTKVCNYRDSCVGMFNVLISFTEKKNEIISCRI
jgi:hypothetical protein